jgi:hypothetical protein
MAERRRFEEWLAALEARRSETPDRVFTRVHADYTTRLEAVVRQLTGHTEGLRAELGRLTTQVAQLTEEQQQARDERAEAELRAHVGELTPVEWEATARAADERIDGLASRHADAETELARTRELLADALRPATPHLSSAPVPAARDATVEASVTASVQAAAASATPASQDVVPDSAEAALHVPSAGPPGTTPDADTEQGRPGSFDELAFLHSVVDTGEVAAGEAPASPAAASEPAPAPAPAPAAPAPPAIAAARRDAAPPRPADEPIVNSDSTADASILGRPGRKGTPMAANISGNHPIVLRDKPVENARTLKCADCGALNFPTEWYCERCGAELASL